MLYMGFPGTMGADAIDYLVTDRSTSPPHLAWGYQKLLGCRTYFATTTGRPSTGRTARCCPQHISPHFVAAAEHPHHPPLASYAWYQKAGHGGPGLREQLRLKHELPPFAFIFCCFNQPTSQASPSTTGGRHTPHPQPCLRPRARHPTHRAA